MKCFIYWTADLKSSKLWSSQLWTQFKQLRVEARKTQDFNGVWTRDGSNRDGFEPSRVQTGSNPVEVLTFLGFYRIVSEVTLISRNYGVVNYWKPCRGLLCTPCPCLDKDAHNEITLVNFFPEKLRLIKLFRFEPEITPRVAEVWPPRILWLRALLRYAVDTGTKNFLLTWEIFIVPNLCKHRGI